RSNFLHFPLEISQSINNYSSFKRKLKKIIHSPTWRTYYFSVTKYNERAPHIQISTHLNEGRVYFTLTDNGIGMDAANGEKVFNLFYQENKARQEGSGIGLAICKNIIEKYDGEIKYESTQGEGTTFFFDLPAA
ncbi:MAG: K+-sensing histidine kinase KdpD, partial [Saprospiraceae bacterium]